MTFRPLRAAAAAALIFLWSAGVYGGQTTFEVLKAFEAPRLHGDAPYAGLIQASDGSFYGTTRFGGASGRGTIFKLDPTGALTTLHHFTGAGEGAYPYAGVIEAADGRFYGTTLSGGTFDSGTIFRLDPSGSLTTLHSFAADTLTYGGLVQAADGSFFGTSQFTRLAHGGTIFKFDSAGLFSIVHGFNARDEGESPFAGLTLGPGGSLYGTTLGGGAFQQGTVFRFEPTGTFTRLHSFRDAASGTSPYADLTLGTDGNLYGTTSGGGSGGQAGTVFKITTTGALTTLHVFSGGDDGGNPVTHVIQGTDGDLYGTTLTGSSGWSTIFRLATTGALTTLFRFSGEFGGGLYGGIMQATDGSLYGTTAQGPGNGGTIYRFDFVSHTTLYSFVDTGLDGAHPYGGVIQNADGSWHGTTKFGGAFGAGTIFTLDSGGALTTARSFAGSYEGAYPQGPLIRSSDGSFVGSASAGGSSGSGVVFKLDGAGTMSVLHALTGVDGSYPHGGVHQTGDGGFVGAATSGGSALHGAVFTLAANGALLVARSFTGANGSYPDAAPIQASDGNVYGTTASGGWFGAGTAFKLDAAGTLTTLHHFGGVDGETPLAGLTQTSDGSLVGTTEYGGLAGAGTVFRIDTTGTLTTLHDFSFNDGAYPVGGVIQGPDGSLYGTTGAGGTPEVNAGTIFKLDAGGVLTTLHRFDPLRDGRYSYGVLAKAADGSFYGTTSEGGPNGGGTVFRLTIPTAAPLTLALSKALIAGCLTTKGAVTLPAPAPGGGTVVTLVSSNAHAPVPATLTFAAGTLTKVFTIKTVAVGTLETANIDAKIGSARVSQTLTLRPIGLASMTLAPNPVIGGSLVSGTMKLECAAGPSSIAVALSSSKPAASPTNGTVLIPAGATTFPFTVTTTRVATTTKPVIAATANGVTKSKTLTVKP